MAGIIYTKEKSFGQHVIIVDETGDTEELYIFDDGFVLHSEGDSQAFAIDYEEIDDVFSEVCRIAEVCGYVVDMSPDMLDFVTRGPIAAARCCSIDEVEYRLPQDEEAVADGEQVTLTSNGSCIAQLLLTPKVLKEEEVKAVKIEYHTD